MSKQQVLEGSWEEILGHAAELTGKQVRLTILESPNEASSQEIKTNGACEDRFASILLDLFQEADGMQSEPGQPSRDPHEAAFGKIVAEKFRR